MATATNNKNKARIGITNRHQTRRWDFRFGFSDVAFDGHLLRNRADEI